MATNDIPQTHAPHDDPSLRALIRQLFGEVPLRLRSEIALARDQLRGSLYAAQEGAKILASGLLLLLAGLVVILLAAVQLLAWLMPLWLAALLVGATALLAGFSLLHAGIRQLELAGRHPQPSGQDAMARDDEY